jgi:hypothetical protein
MGSWKIFRPGQWFVRKVYGAFWKAWISFGRPFVDAEYLWIRLDQSGKRLESRPVEPIPTMRLPGFEDSV